ncbi:hypothetical protein HPP92_011267 [Vanilla planifolia]|uniref:C2H2-type domain-containing protein n=1 Tax=Vanilla planifolia TaxID=51239 RepID=A0A835RB58_VANPL|nr:hypothetical protein HPP92_011267 [Vanilla planifolia]
MEFWGIEVKPGQSMKCEPGEHKLLHLSQASLGEIKREKGTENIPIFVKANGQKLVIGTLSSEKCTQIQYDLVFEKVFELSHGSKNTSVFFVGYRSISQGYEYPFCLCCRTIYSDSEDEPPIHGKPNGKTSKTEKGKSIAEIAATGKDDKKDGKPNAKADKKNKVQIQPEKKVVNKHGEDDSDEEEDDGDSMDASDEDEEMSEGSSDDGLEDDDETSEEDITPEKKRKDASASKTSVPEKKAKVVTPTGNQNQKSVADGKKGGHVATPHPAKQGGKAIQPPKTSGSATCKTCSKSFNSENALQAHKKAKHGATAK